MPRAIVGIGGNLGARHAIFACAEALLARQPGCHLLARSRLYASAPLGPPQPDYLNAAFSLDYDGEAEALLDVLRQVEQQLGRLRRERWGARTLDLDLLDWSAGPVQTERLTVPHPEIERRNFVLAPMLDLAADLPSALATRYEAALRDLGGAPPLAAPGWPEPSDPAFVPPSEELPALQQRAERLVREVGACGDPP